MTHDPTNDVLQELEAALTLAPSPEFADGVRARIRSESTRRRAWPMWAMAGLAAAAAIALVVLTRQQFRPKLQPTAGEAPQVAAVARPTSSPPVASAEQGAPRPTPRREPHRSARATASAEPVFEVISNQGEILRRLWARVTPSGTLKEVDAPRAEPPLGGNAAIVSDAVTAPVAIAPVVVKPLGDGGGDRPDQPTIRNREINAGRAR